jgi:hypothetical protein
MWAMIEKLRISFVSVMGRLMSPENSVCVFATSFISWPYESILAAVARYARTLATMAPCTDIHGR